MFKKESTVVQPIAKKLRRKKISNQKKKGQQGRENMLFMSRRMGRLDPKTTTFHHLMQLNARKLL